MRRNQFLGMVGILAITLGGCASEETPPAAEAPAPSPVAASPAAPNAVTAPQPAASPTIVAQQPPNVPGLIPSTNIQERQKQVDTRIQGDKTKDPFAAVPPVLPKPDNATVPDVSKLPAGSNGTGNQGTSGNGSGRAPGTARTPDSARPKPVRPRSTAANKREIDVEAPLIRGSDEPLGISLPAVAPPVPPPPSTDTAAAIQVTGVVVVGGEPRAIIVAPNDATSRYVSVGQRISGGKVLVKRIEVGNGSEPIVIFEENGVEVARAVGEKTTVAANPSTPNQ